MKALIVLALLSITAFAHTVPQHRLDEAWWVKRWNEKKAEAAKGGHNLLFIGDSITHYFEREGSDMWEKYYAPHKALNFGLSGDRTEHVIWRLNDLDWSTVQPKVTVIMIGTNNTGHKEQDPQKSAEGIYEIVEIVKAKAPGTKILLLGVFPRAFDKDDRKRKINERINEVISHLHDGKHVHYLDLSSNFLQDDGSLNKELVPDGLHPKEAGYKVWGEAMQPTLKALLTEEK